MQSSCWIYFTSRNCVFNCLVATMWSASFLLLKIPWIQNISPALCRGGMVVFRSRSCFSCAQECYAFWRAKVPKALCQSSKSRFHRDWDWRRSSLQTVVFQGKLGIMPKINVQNINRKSRIIVCISIWAVVTLTCSAAESYAVTLFQGLSCYSSLRTEDKALRWSEAIFLTINYKTDSLVENIMPIQ